MTPDTPAVRPARSKTLRLWLIIGSVVAAVSVIPAALMGMMSVMASDAGVNTMIYVFIYTMLSFPVAIVLGPVLAWIAYAIRRERASWILLFSPFAWVLVLIVIFSLGLGQPNPV
jgi:hypothetical protein